MIQLSRNTAMEAHSAAESLGFFEPVNPNPVTAWLKTDTFSSLHQEFRQAKEYAHLDDSSLLYASIIFHHNGDVFATPYSSKEEARDACDRLEVGRG